MNPTELLELIKSRRSVRRFEPKPVSPEMIETILEAGRWSPSGQNNQPWRFVVVTDPALKEELAPLTKYHEIIKGAAALICTFIHTPSMYNETKDHQSVGACLQTMLLMIHGLGLGAVWLGEILKSAAEVRSVLGLGQDYELMAVVCLGHPAGGSREPWREPLDELVLARR